MLNNFRHNLQNILCNRNYLGINLNDIMALKTYQVVQRVIFFFYL